MHQNRNVTDIRSVHRKTPTKRRLIATVMLSSRRSGLLNLMAMSEF